MFPEEALVIGPDRNQHLWLTLSAARASDFGADLVYQGFYGGLPSPSSAVGGVEVSKVVDFLLKVGTTFR